MDVEFTALAAKTATMKEVRELYELTQENVATILGCTQSNVSKLDNRLISLAHLVTITESLGYYVNILFTNIPLVTETG